MFSYVTKRVTFFAALLMLMLAVVPSAAQPPPDPGMLIDWHPNGTMIAYAYFEANEVVIWDTGTNTVLHRFTTESVQRIEPKWSHDGELLAFRDSLYSIAVWSNPWDPTLASRDYHLDLISRLGSPDIPPIYDFDWHPSEQHIAFALSSILGTWELSTDVYRELPYNERISEISDLTWFDADTLLLGDSLPQAALIDIQSGQTETSYFLSRSVSLETVWAIAPSPDRTEVALISSLGSLEIWDPTQGTFYEGFGLYTSESEQSTYVSESSISSLEWHPTGEYLAASDYSGIIRIWDAQTLELVEEYDRGVAGLPGNTVAWSPDGTQLAFGTADGLEIVDAPPLTATVTPTATPRSSRSR